MYADRVVCCPLVSHGEYASRALLRLEKDGTDRQTDGQSDRYITLSARCGRRNKTKVIVQSQMIHTLLSTLYIKSSDLDL